MAITQVGVSQATTANPVASTTGVSLTRTAGAINNLLVVSGYTADVNAAVTVSDTQGNTWVAVNPDFNDTTNTSRLASWYALAKNTSSTTVTVKSTSGSSSFWGITFEEFTGNATTSPLDQVAHSTAGASGADVSSPSITLGANDCLVWSLLVDTASNGNTIDSNVATVGANDGSGDWTEFVVLTGRSGAAVNASWFSSGAYESFIASFKPSVAAGPTTAQELPAFVENRNAGGMVGLGWM